MTPEQLQQYVDAALKQRDQFNLVFYPLTIVLSIGGAWLISYLREKGKNLATKEDIAEITTTQEKIRTELANRSHFSRARYDREMEVYQKVWPKLMNFFDATYSTDFRSDIGLEHFDKVKNEAFTAIRENKPFFPKEVCHEILEFQNLCEDAKFSEMILKARQLNPDEEKSYLASGKRIKAQLDKVEEAIRNRLSKFD